MDDEPSVGDQVDFWDDSWEMWLGPVLLRAVTAGIPRFRVSGASDPVESGAGWSAWVNEIRHATVAELFFDSDDRPAPEVWLDVEYPAELPWFGDGLIQLDLERDQFWSAMTEQRPDVDVDASGDWDWIVGKHLRIGDYRGWYMARFDEAPRPSGRWLPVRVLLDVDATPPLAREAAA